MERHFVLWTAAHALLLPALVVVSRGAGSRADLVLLLSFAPALGAMQAVLIPAVDDRWTWPVMTCSGALMALFVCCPWPIHVGFLLGLAQCHVFTAAGHRWGLLWLLASGAGWLNGVLAGRFATDLVFHGDRTDPRWLPLGVAILGLVYGATTGLVFPAFRAENRQPGRPWSEP